ncbi:MAG: helix-turn-helix domain-containing protein [Anaerovorax sp.]
MTITNIKLLMKRKGIGNKDLSEKSGIPIGTLNKIIYGETKNPSLDTMRSLARALDCTLDDFTDNEYIGKDDQHQGYYLNEDAAKMAQEIYENPNLRILFDASRNVSTEDLQFVVDMMKRLKGDDD